jgi:hypothetical protein
MVAVVLIASNTIGALPLLVGILIKSVSNPDAFSQLTANPNDYSVLGLDPNVLLIMMIVPFVAGLAAFKIFVKPLNGRTLKKTINGTDRIRWNRFFISALIWFLLSAIYFFIYLKLDPANFTLNNSSVSIIILVLISVLLIPFQAAFEEVLFRGYLMQGFAVLLKNRWMPMVITSVLFGLMHSLNPEVKEFGFLTMIPQYIIFGMIFGIITILDDGIEAAMGAHAANNIFLCIMVTNRSSALQTQAIYEQHNIYPWTEFTALLLTGIIFILILKRVLKWEGFGVLFSKLKVEKDPIQIP